MTNATMIPLKATELPEWASAHLERHLGHDVQVVNAHIVDRGPMTDAILLNTTEGAALLSKHRFGAPVLVRLRLPGRRFAFACLDCKERIELMDAETPRPFFCTRCARHYRLSREGDNYVLFTAMDGAAPTPKPRGPGWTRIDPDKPLPPETQWHEAVKRKAKRAAAPKRRVSKKQPGASKTQRGAASPPRKDLPFRYKGYTLHTRHVALKNGRSQRIYFFSKHGGKNATPTRKPQGFQVMETKTGLPVLRRAAGGTAAAGRKPGKKAKRVAPRCAAKTDAGTPCRNTSRQGSRYCAAHHGHRPRAVTLKKAATASKKAKDYEPQCQALSEGGKQCRNSSRHGSKYCVSHFGYRPPRAAATRGRGKDTKPSVKGAEDTRPSHRKAARRSGRKRPVRAV